MANTIRIKRRASGAAGAPSTLKNAEVAFNEVDDVLYYGKGTGGAEGSATTVEAVAGKGAFLALSGAQTVTGDKTFSGTANHTGPLQISGTAITATAAEINKLAGVTAGTASASKALVVDANKDIDLAGGSVAAANLVLSGNLTVNGTTTTINSTTMSVDDKNIVLGDVTTPTDVTADGGGITLKGTTDKTILYSDAISAWSLSENLNIVTGKAFEINGTSVLSGSALGSGVTGSSLTSVGTLTSGTWSATTIALAAGGTGATSATDARTNLGLAIGSDVQGYDAELAAIAGLTSIADRVPYFTGSGTASLATFTSFGRTLAGSADAAAARTSIGLAVGTDVQAYDAELAALASVTSAANALPYFTGSGTAAVTTLSAFGRTLIDDADAAAAQATLGLGSMATQAASNVAITGGSIDGVTFDGGSF
ncbi:hypothetical protein UFOVP1625_34 [uncultured Caudovirales phage]|uniref:Major tropism determinant N-terminal domain-containing protein n=1 Tax=uncultured Caudovirales phage TaxID=2100421 RepID=A0A6J5T0J3_9CAUD|nr:hypothetical protein UFOVP1625_34 [uncultured Caudovirales phage]